MHKGERCLYKLIGTLIPLYIVRVYVAGLQGASDDNDRDIQPAHVAESAFSHIPITSGNIKHRFRRRNFNLSTRMDVYNTGVRELLK